MADDQKGETIAGVAVVCGMAGFASFVVAVFSFFSGNFVGAGVCLAVAGPSFGLVSKGPPRRAP